MTALTSAALVARFPRKPLWKWEEEVSAPAQHDAHCQIVRSRGKKPAVVFRIMDGTLVDGCPAFNVRTPSGLKMTAWAHELNRGLFRLMH